MQLGKALGREGIWTRQFDMQHGTVAEKAVGELEALPPRPGQYSIDVLYALGYDPATFKT